MCSCRDTASELDQYRQVKARSAQMEVDIGLDEVEYAFDKRLERSVRCRGSRVFTTSDTRSGY